VDEPVTASLIFGGSLLAWSVLEVSQGRHSRTGATRADRGSLVVLRVTTAAGFAFGVVVAHVAPAASISRDVALWIGMTLLWSGIALRAWSFRTLGDYFTFTVQTSSDQTLITDGPYRFVRHPSYLGMVLALLGVAFQLANWLALVAVAVPMIAGLVYRIQVEEQALDDELGERWRTYAGSRSRLVPHVW
jgi:protein-S-isoprenylcysteine O-methyltransferase Ste14